MPEIGVWNLTGIFGGLISAFVVFYVQRRQRIARGRGTLVSTVAFAALVAYIWTPFGFPNSSWGHAPIGTEAVRLIPIVDFDPALLKTPWLSMQLLIGGATYLLANLALYGDARRSLFVTVGIMAVGLEVSQGLENLVSGVVPQYRVDIHDIITRALGAAIVYAAMKLFGALWRWRVPVRSDVVGIAGFVDSIARRN